MAYLAGSIAIWVKGLFHSDWLGDGSQRLILAHSVVKSGTPYTIGESCQWIWQVFLTLCKQNCHVELSCNTPSPLSPSWAIAPLFSRPRANYFNQLLLLLFITHISKILCIFFWPTSGSFSKFSPLLQLAAKCHPRWQPTRRLAVSCGLGRCH
jgi:hypothetical protein